MSGVVSNLQPGRLLLVPTPLDFGCTPLSPIDAVLPALTLQMAAQTSHWIVENAKSARAFLKRVDAHCPLHQPVQAQCIEELPREVHKKGDHTGHWDARPMLAAALQGHDVGLLSEAGMPAIADPGRSVVRAAHDMGLQVVPLVGPVSLLLALASSGLNGQQFAFVGYLPQEPAQRLSRIKQLENLALQTGQSQMWIETPYRNAAMFQALLQGLQGQTRLAIASGLTLATASIQSRSVAAWKKSGQTVQAQMPTVFAIGA